MDKDVFWCWWEIFYIHLYLWLELFWFEIRFISWTYVICWTFLQGYFTDFTCFGCWTWLQMFAIISPCLWSPFCFCWLYEFYIHLYLGNLLPCCLMCVRMLRTNIFWTFLQVYFAVRTFFNAPNWMKMFAVSPNYLWSPFCFGFIIY